MSFFNFRLEDGVLAVVGHQLTLLLWAHADTVHCGTSLWPASRLSHGSQQTNEKWLGSKLSSIPPAMAYNYMWGLERSFQKRVW